MAYKPIGTFTKEIDRILSQWHKIAALNERLKVQDAYIRVLEQQLVEERLEHQQTLEFHCPDLFNMTKGM
jgi:hypothetical protein